MVRILSRLYYVAVLGKNHNGLLSVAFQWVGVGYIYIYMGGEEFISVHIFVTMNMRWLHTKQK